MKAEDWQELATTSHYRTAVAIHEALREGNMDDATAGLEELIEALSRADARALRSHLVRLIQHIITWQVQPQLRSQRWVAAIAIQRQEIADLREENPRFTEAYIRERLWDRCVQLAVKEAERDLNHAILEPPSAQPERRLRDRLPALPKKPTVTSQVNADECCLLLEPPAERLPAPPVVGTLGPG